MASTLTADYALPVGVGRCPCPLKEHEGAPCVLVAGMLAHQRLIVVMGLVEQGPVAAHRRDELRGRLLGVVLHDGELQGMAENHSHRRVRRHCSEPPSK